MNAHARLPARGTVMRRWITGRLCGRRRARGILIRQRRAAWLPAHRPTGRRGTPVASPGFVWRSPGRHRNRALPGVALFRFQLNLRFRTMPDRLGRLRKVAPTPRGIAGRDLRILVHRSNGAAAAGLPTPAGTRRRPETPAAGARRPLALPLTQRVPAQSPEVPQRWPGAATYRHRIRTVWRELRDGKVPAASDGQPSRPGGVMDLDFAHQKLDRGRLLRGSTHDRSISDRVPTRPRGARLPERRQAVHPGPLRSAVVLATRPKSAGIRMQRDAVMEARPLMAARRAEQARRVVHGPSWVPTPPVARVPARPLARMVPGPAPAAPIGGRTSHAVPELRPVVRHPAPTGHGTLPRSAVGPTAMTHIVQRSRRITTEADRRLLEQTVIDNVTRNVSENLVRTVDETVRRKLADNADVRTGLIEQLGNTLYDNVVLERERLG